MSERRRMLLAIVNQFKWLPYSYTYLYHSLVPQTISGKNVRNKAKLAKIYGNSEVRNQLCDFTNDFVTKYVNGITIETDLVNKTIRYHGTASANAVCGFISSSNDKNNLVVGHKYLLKLNKTGNSGNSKCSVVGLSSSWLDIADNIYTGIGTSQYGQVIIYNGEQVDFTIAYELIDLTKAYPFDTPTTITDNRVKNILAQGYIPYNTGEIKDMVIGEIGSEPYNLFDEELEPHDINFTNGSNGLGDNNFRTKNYIKVVGGRDYTFEYDRDTLAGHQYIMEYDENYNYIGYQGGFNVSPKTITVSTNTRYIRVQYFKASSGWGTTNFPTQAVAKVCVHFTGTRTGYAPYKAPTTLQLPAPYQASGIGTSKDSWEITNTSHIFTRNNFWGDLGSLTYTKDTATGSGLPLFRVGINEMATQISGVLANVLCGKYTTDLASNLWNSPKDKTIGVLGNSKNLVIYDTAYSSGTASDFQTAMSGVMLKYQLATPQTITIPRKHLAVVDLGTLNWIYISGSNSRFVADVSNIKLVSQGTDLANIYCSQYMTDSVSHIYSHTNNNSIGVHNTYQQIWIYDSAKNSMSTTDFKNAMQGQYLFYETDTEVADITDTFDIEAGGSVNGNLFSWVENQLVVNGNFESSSGWTIEQGGTLTYGNNKLIVNTNGNNQVWFYQTNHSVIANHKYLCAITSKATMNCSFWFTIPYYSYVAHQLVANQKLLVSEIVIPDTSSSGNIAIRFNSGTNVNGETIEFENFIVIDLTLGFGAGNEPTSINDYRIQYILEHGYIPTNTTGTQTSVDTQVLPNVDMSFKCK